MRGIESRVDAILSHDTAPRVLTWPELRTTLSQPLVLPTPVQFHLMRQGETETNARNLVTGARDVPLTALGEEQARQIGRHLDPYYELAFHSSLSRSRNTLFLALTAGHIRVDQICCDGRLNERSLGELELQPWRSVDEYARGDLYYAPEGGDSYAEVARRCLSFLIDLAEIVAVARPEKILVCAHMGSMRILLGILDERLDPAGVLAQSFGNTQVFRVVWKCLVLPGFLRERTTDDECRGPIWTQRSALR